MNFPRRRFLATAGISGLGVAGFTAGRIWPEQGLFNPCFATLPSDLLGHALVREAWAGLGPADVWDCHAHLLGIGDAGNVEHASYNDAKGTWRWPLTAVQKYFFLNAACASSASIDQAYVSRLHTLATSMPPGHKLLLLALDAWHDEKGRSSPAHTHVFVSNDYCAAVAQAAPDRFEWAASVHPYRPDAQAELERIKRLGARAVKWIPAAQGIDPAAPRCDEFYSALVRLELPLISHAGEERAMPGDDALGNPLRLRRALESGVRVIVAHCASMGSSQDLDLGTGSDRASTVDNFSLFERMMDEPAHVGRLFGDISALTQTARADIALKRIMQRAVEGGDWADRLLNGSDYPLPAIMPLYSPRLLADAGYLEAGMIEPLTAIRKHHALLFDFVLKRHLKLDGRRLASSIFRTRHFFAPAG